MRTEWRIYNLTFLFIYFFLFESIFMIISALITIFFKRKKMSFYAKSYRGFTRGLNFKRLKTYFNIKKKKKKSEITKTI